MSAQANETIFRLRSLHGVYERALMNAGDLLVENVKSKLTSRGWFEAILKQASGELEAAGVFHGRWSLFSTDELLQQLGMLTQVLGVGTPEQDEMRSEIEAELIRRKVGFPIPAGESSTVATGA